MMNNKYGMFTKEQVQEMSDRGDTTVYQHDYENRFDPYSTDKVMICIDKILELMKLYSDDIHAYTEKDADLVDFAQKYQVFYKNLTDKNFIAKKENIATVRKLVHIKSRMDNGEISEDNARAQCSTIALATTLKK